MASSYARTALEKLSLKKIRKKRTITNSSARKDEYNNNNTILVRDANIWTPNRIRKGSILIEEGRIKKIGKRVFSRADETIDASGLIAIPGLVDVHVHLRDLELAYKETFTTGTAAAAAGGFTTVLDMPNTVPPTDSASRLIEKQKVAAQKIYVNV